MSNSLNRCYGFQLQLFRFRIAVREHAQHLVIKTRGGLNTEPRVDGGTKLVSDLSGPFQQQNKCLFCVFPVNQKHLPPAGRNTHFRFSSQTCFIVLYRAHFSPEASDFWLRKSPEPTGWLSLAITNEETGCR